ncbi:MAG: FAD-binding oxidoreductase [Proteobacteria bacterium]|nr:FAD-binding oxidoreductase [Pseudomonadota bacterium]
MHTRRTIAALGAATIASSCATARNLLHPSRGRLAPVHVAAERIIRVDVGLRPYRASGFRVEREVLGEKALIHNYGHGGGGITLSWGTAKLAVDLGYDGGKPDCAVIGCGAVGMATARLLQERGARVRIYARDLPPNTTSDVAGAQWWPSSVFHTPEVRPQFLEQYYTAAHFAFRRYQTFVGDVYGVSWEANYSLSDTPTTTYPAREDSPMRDLVINQQDLAPHEHPFAARYVRRFDTMMIETPLYLRRIEADVREAGGEIVVREFHDVAELRTLPEQTIFNCTGLAAGRLFGDTTIEPVRGQLVILEPQAEVDYNVLRDGDYMFGRRDGIVLGGTFQHGNWSTEPDPEVTQRLLRHHQEIFGAMRQ